MTGDGTNDAPALAQADVAIAMNTGTQAAREAGNMVDLDSNPTKLLEVVEVGKQLLMTRGCLTTFSIANDVAKYFAILPAMFMVVFPEIAPLNVMRLASPQSAILSAVIFNALIIVALIPLALRGVRYRPLGAAALLRRSLLDLRRGRRGRAVRRHQARRHRAEPRRARLRRTPVKKELVVALRMTVATLVLTGLVYPLLVTGVAQVVFPWRANGSLVSAEGRVVGSELIGQGFKSPAYFQSAALGGGRGRLRRRELLGLEPRPDVAEAARPRRRRRRAPAGGEPAGAGRGAGRARHRPRRAASTRTCAPEAARWQVPRVAAARGVAAGDVQALVDARTEAAHVRPAGRAARQRAPAEPRPRPALPASGQREADAGSRGSVSGKGAPPLGAAIRRRHRWRIALFLAAAVLVLAALGAIAWTVTAVEQVSAVEAERDSWQRPADVLQALELRNGAVVADLGSGVGYFALKLAERVGRGGRVLAVDVRRFPLAVPAPCGRGMRGLRNLETVHGAPDDPHLPAGGVDAVLVANTFHELEDQARASSAGPREALRPAGRLVVVDPAPSVATRSARRGTSTITTSLPIRRKPAAPGRSSRSSAGTTGSSTPSSHGRWWLIVARKP